MNISRTLKHLFVWPASFSATFSPAMLRAVQDAIKASEGTHTAELRFVAEESLPMSYLWHDAAPRTRALNLFSKLRIWDTEQNNGVLIYALFAEHKIELVADRAAARAIPQQRWDAWVIVLQKAFRSNDVAANTCAVIQEIGVELAVHFPLGKNGDSAGNELSDAPVVIRR
ncbi:MAG: TPM domain-containing protein [Burkholderiaceae bacterium]